MKCKVIIAPNPIRFNRLGKTIFLAGGITDCPDWQSEMITSIENLKGDDSVTLFNPRRPKFDVKKKGIARQQIEWEFDALHAAHIISFWFCKETLNPIVLYELGAALERNSSNGGGNQQIIIGVEPGYERAQDVEIQTELLNPDIKIVSSLKELVETIEDRL